MTSVPINLANKFNSSLARSDEPAGSELADIKSEVEGEILTLGNNFSSTSGTSSDSSAQLEILGLFHSLHPHSGHRIRTLISFFDVKKHKLTNAYLTAMYK